MDKKTVKHAAQKCRFAPKYCDSDDYTVLDVHRITPGAEGGKYTKENTVVVCSNCHRRIHAGEIEVDRYYQTTKGRLLYVIVNGEEDYI